MSIPKQPRQIMINIMYLVLTAILALNVSAEIFNAFKVVEKGLDKSNLILDDANARIPQEIEKLAKKKTEMAQYAERTNEVNKLSKEFCTYVDEIIGELETMAKGYRVDEVTGEVTDELYDKKNKDITTNFLVGLEPQKKEGKGHDLEGKIMEYRQKFLELIDEEDRADFAKNVSLSISEDWKKTTGKSRGGKKFNWAHFNFYQMPVAAVMPMLKKIKNDAKSTEAAALNYLLNKVGGTDIVFDQFRVVSSPKKSYIIKGEKFETEIFLSAFSSNIQGMSVSVNGRGLPVADGVAKYEVTTSSTGVAKYTANINITNPVTGETTSSTGEFEYEVGERSCNVSADKMNVFYMGVDNPISVSAAGISSNDLSVSASGGGIKLTKLSPGKYNATVSEQGEAKITVSGGGLAPTNFTFRTKRIPDPIAKLSQSTGGAMGNGEFKAQGGVVAILEGFDFDAKCEIQGFTLVRVAKRQDPESAINPGGRYRDDATRLVNQARPGDKYWFENVKARCPGDKAGRKINDMVFNIK